MQCSKIPALFDHLVGGDQKTRRRGKTDRLCRFQVEDRFKLGGSLRRYFAGLCAVQNTVNTGSDQPELLNEIEAVRLSDRRRGPNTEMDKLPAGGAEWRAQ